jgi:hypothetical protein
VILYAFEARSELRACDIEQGRHFIDVDVVPGFGLSVVMLGNLQQKMVESGRESTNLACQCGAVVFGAYKKIYMDEGR